MAKHFPASSQACPTTKASTRKWLAKTAEANGVAPADVVDYLDKLGGAKAKRHLRLN